MFRGLSTDIDNHLVILLSAGEVKWEDNSVFYLVSGVKAFFIIVCKT